MKQAPKLVTKKTTIVDCLSKPPFNLDAEAIEWVLDTFSGLSEADRIAQLFCFRSRGAEQEVSEMSAYKPGAILRNLTNNRDFERKHINAFQKNADVPLLISADLEGSRMSVPFGTQVPNPLALAAIDDVEVTAEVAKIMALEACDVGLNWSYTPVLDINAAFRSAIVATRGYGSDVKTISRHAMAQLEAFQSNGIAATLMHWPGEGYDDRDQHLLTTINPLNMDEWHNTFGVLYKELIDAGAMSVMSAHIALPAYAKTKGAEGAELYRPASTSLFLNHDLLRGELGFNGLIVSDASEMAGISSWCPAPQSKVAILVGGCDMVLMSSDPATEMAAVIEAVQTGAYPRSQMEVSVIRVLGLKASLGLHRYKQPRNDPDSVKAHQPKPVDYAANCAYATDIMTRAPTLVKDTQSLLPITLSDHRRILIISTGIVEPTLSENLSFVLPNLLGQEGFEVTVHKPGQHIDTESYDLVLYLMGEETLLTRGHIFLDWLKLSGFFVGAMQRTWHDVPTAMISFGYPYYLYGAPRMPTYINAYCTMDEMQNAVVELLLGRAQWQGKNPIDPFAGAPDAKY